jgi:predicted MFS family arabinose efflux permease
LVPPGGPLQALRVSVPERTPPPSAQRRDAAGRTSRREHPGVALQPAHAGPWRLLARVLLPFAAGYYLSYLFRTINALIAGDLAADLGLGAADLGFVTSVYFLVLAAAQLPLGALLDRYGPRTLQSILLLVAGVGALLFARAHSLATLIIGRALIGIGVSLALMAGLKAIVTWFPPERCAIANGALVMLGALGAVTATVPAEIVVGAIGWRGLFGILALASAATALGVLLLVPEAPAKPRGAGSGATVWDVYRDRRFWRIAPLSSLGVGTSWSLQGLWAAPWLRDVAGLERGAIVAHLGVMALSVSASALALGIAADRLRRRGVGTEVLLGAAFLVSMGAQAGLLLGWPIPSLVLWAVIAAAGATTVLSFAFLATFTPNAVSGRANAALNLLHIGVAFVLQTATGLIIARWDKVGSGYPPEAHQAALAGTLALQMAAFAWFALRRRGPAEDARGAGVAPCVAGALGAIARSFPSGLRSANVPARGRRSAVVSARWEIAHARYAGKRRRQRPDVRGWRLAAAGSGLLSLLLGSAVTVALSRPAVAVHVVTTQRHARDDRSCTTGAAGSAGAAAPTPDRSREPERWGDLYRAAREEPLEIPRPRPVERPHGGIW